MTEKSQDKYFRLRDGIRDLLNSLSMEGTTDTPDFILSEYMVGCLKAFEEATIERKKMTQMNKENCE